ncbi:MAG: fibronectin type III domain-containing protein [Oscillospiraceae bacterium]|nr:fibronectin type III domain-containing protein [Oscillospiraceae bacterium]
MKKTLKNILSLLCAASFVITPLTAYENEMPGISITAEAASKLSAPENVSASKTADSITLKWNAVKGADAYRVYKYDEKSEEFVKYKNVSGTSCKVTDLEKNTKYIFKIASLKNVDDKFSEQGITGKISATTKSSDSSSSDSSKSASSDYTGFKTKDGKKYYYENGKAVTGFKKIDSSRYYFTKSGMLTGWLDYYGLYYYFDKEGKMVKNKTLSIGGTEYTFDSSGVMEYIVGMDMPKAKCTVKGDDLKISILTTSKSNADASLTVMKITNNGKKDLTIYPIGSSSDSSYEAFDRALFLLNDSLKYDGKPLTIKAGKSEYVTFAYYSSSTYKASPTWYDKKTRSSFYVKYDKTFYFVTTSYYYGTFHIKTHIDIEDKFEDLFDL